MSTAIAKQNTNELTIDTGYQGAFSSASNFESAQRMAMALCASSMVPKQFQGKENLGNAIIALEMSQRIGANPLMVMQNLYLVHGNPGWSAKFLIATFNQCGRFSAIRYEWKEGDSKAQEYGCRAYAVEKKTGETIYGPWITWALVKSEGWDSKNGSKWKTMPEKMFMYRAAAWMIDAYAPEISMGLSTEDQMHEVYDIDPNTGNVIGGSFRHGKANSLDDLLLDSAMTEKVDTETGEITEAPSDAVSDVTEQQLEALLNDADSLESIEDVEGMIDGLPSEAAKKRIVAICKMRREELSE